jgi:hypothetical protein
VVLYVLSAAGCYAVAKEWISRMRETSPGTAGARDTWLGAGVTLLSAVIGLPLIWYTTDYLPANMQTVLSVDAALDGVKAKKGVVGKDGVHVTANIKVTNTGSAPVRILFSQYEIVGSPVAQTHGPKVDARLEARKEGGDDTAARYGAFADFGRASLIQFGRIFWDQTSLEPGEKTKLTLVAFYPKKTFDLVSPSGLRSTPTTCTETAPL